MTSQTPDKNAGIMLVTRNFPPLLGGMERLNHHMLLGLVGEEPLYLVGPAGCRAHAPSNAHVIEVPAAPLWKFLIAALAAALRLARRRPRVILAGSGVTAPMAWLAAKLYGARSAVYLHGLDLVVPNGIYQRLWLPFIRRCDLAVTNSTNTARLAAEKGVEEYRLHVVNPGTELHGPDPRARVDFRNEHGLGQRPMLLSVGRLTPRKGLAEFVRDVMPGVLSVRPDAVLLVIGTDAKDALSTQPGSTRERVLATARLGGALDAIRFLPPCDDATLHAAYHAADLHVFPVREIAGDVEGFGMVAIEAAAHGLPTVAYRTGGVGDAVLEGATGTLVRAGDHVAFGDAILEWLSRAGEPAARDGCAGAARVFAWSNFNSKLRGLLRMPSGSTG